MGLSGPLKSQNLSTTHTLILLTPPTPAEETAGPRGTHPTFPILPLKDWWKSPEDDSHHQQFWKEARQQTASSHLLAMFFPQSCGSRRVGTSNTKKGARSRWNHPPPLRASSSLLTHPAGSRCLHGQDGFNLHPCCCSSHSGCLRTSALLISSELTLPHPARGAEAAARLRGPALFGYVLNSWQLLLRIHSNLFWESLPKVKKLESYKLHFTNAFAAIHLDMNSVGCSNRRSEGRSEMIRLNTLNPATLHCSLWQGSFGRHGIFL